MLRPRFQLGGFNEVSAETGLQRSRSQHRYAREGGYRWQRGCTLELACTSAPSYAERMDTLKAASELKAAGIEDRHAEAISRVMNDLGRDNLVTKDYLDMRLWQHTAAIAVLGAGIILLGVVG